MIAKYMCDNQMCISDFLHSNDETDKSEGGPPILLSVGQIVYKVIFGDVIKYRVYDERPWLCGSEESPERGYRLKEDGKGFGVAWNRSLGVDIFTNQEDANQAAEMYLKNNECIRKEDIVPVETVAYSYVRDVDRRVMTAFYSILDNGMVYMKEFMTYHHICSNAGLAIKKFMAQKEFEYDQPVKIDCVPEFKNMYPCAKGDSWNYAECNYSGCIGDRYRKELDNQ